MQGIIRAVCISEEKGTEKHPVASARLIPAHGMEGDAHAGPWHRQVSLLCYEKVEEFNRRGALVGDGAFGENLLVSGIDFRTLPVGTILTTANTVLRITQVGKECHSHCAIYQLVGTCIMPREGVFAEVLRGGEVAPGERMTAAVPDEAGAALFAPEESAALARVIAAGIPAALRFQIDGREYIRRFQPPERLILLGCGHIAQPLCEYAADLGFSVTVVDERPAFANRTRFPKAEQIVCDSFSHAIAQLDIGARDYVAVITRGHRYDADCLRAILGGEFPKYLGMIGSRRRVALLLNALEGEGFPREALDRICAPIGVDIHAQTVREIALAIAAELVLYRREKQRRSADVLAAEDIPRQLLEFLADGSAPKALLTVYETSGSTPVHTGAMMAVDRALRTAGTIGGGCSENAVMHDAVRMIGTGGQRTVTVDMSNELAAEDGMVCGGKMKVLITDAP